MLPPVSFAVVKPPPLREVLLLTFHAYGTWMPDRPQGYYRNRDGLREANDAEADWYRGRQKEPTVRFDRRIQRAMVDALVAAAGFQRWTFVAAATDDCHLHVLAGTSDERDGDELQRLIKKALTYDLNAMFGRRTWFSRNGHNRRVRDREHYVWVREEYLPSHRGVRWDRRDA